MIGLILLLFGLIPRLIVSYEYSLSLQWTALILIWKSESTWREELDAGCFDAEFIQK